MNKLTGESLMTIGWIAATLIAIIFLAFFQNDINPDNRITISGLFALSWGASSIIYAGGMRVKNRLKQKTLDSQQSTQ